MTVSRVIPSGEGEDSGGAGSSRCDSVAALKVARLAESSGAEVSGSSATVAVTLDSVGDASVAAAISVERFSIIGAGSVSTATSEMAWGDDVDASNKVGSGGRTGFAILGDLVSNLALGFLAGAGAGVGESPCGAGRGCAASLSTRLVS